MRVCLTGCRFFEVLQGISSPEQLVGSGCKEAVQCFAQGCSESPLPPAVPRADEWKAHNGRRCVPDCSWHAVMFLASSDLPLRHF